MPSKRIRKSWLDQLKEWHQAHSEFYAKQILGPPKRTTLLRAIPHPGLVLILGLRGSGKTASAHEIAAQLKASRKVKAVCHLEGISEVLRNKVQKMLPSWLKVTSDRNDWPEGGIIIYDEAAQSMHARRAQAEEAVNMEILMGTSRQRKQTILFIAHHSRKIDIGVIRDIDCVLFKQPTYAHAIWERDEMADLTWRALEFFKGLRGEKEKKRANLLIDFRDFSIGRFSNDLPFWWTDKLSHIFKDIEVGLHGKNNGKTMSRVFK